MSKIETVTIPKKDLSGSRLRCLMLTSLPGSSVAKVLFSLVSPLATVDEKKHHWMPRGLLNPEEPKLGECSSFLTPEIPRRPYLMVADEPPGANTPNWDIVSTCTVEGRYGLILIEAKAHDSELKPEGNSQGNAGNDQRIFSAIPAQPRFHSIATDKNLLASALGMLWTCRPALLMLFR
jgi:hypothetical protein